jgi:hypothetical protein
VRDHLIEEEKCVGVSSPCRGVSGGGDRGLKCGEEWWWLGHWCVQEAEGRGGYAHKAGEEKPKEWGAR